VRLDYSPAPPRAECVVLGNNMRRAVRVTPDIAESGGWAVLVAHQHLQGWQWLSHVSARCRFSPEGERESNLGCAFERVNRRGQPCQ